MIRAGLILLLVVPVALAQAPVQDAVSREQAIQRGQQRAGAAYRELGEAEYQAKLAEQEFLNAQAAQRAAQRQLDAAKKAFDGARAREAKARKDYDDALTAVDKAFGKPPAKQ